MNLKRLKSKYRFIKSLWSPFKPFKLKWYIGKTKIGTPYFYPRRWVKFTKDDAVKAALKDMENPHKAKQSFNKLYNSYKNYKKSVPRRIGFDFIGLGWKTKWDDTDYRFEWSPVFSFVFFGFQIACTVIAPHQDHYWEAWLYYEYNTDKTKTKEERIKQCKDEFSLKYTQHSSGGKETIDSYPLVLRNKYL